MILVVSKIGSKPKFKCNKKKIGDMHQTADSKILSNLDMCHE